MKGQNEFIAIAALVVIAIAFPVSAGVEFKQDKTFRAIEISGLFADPSCHPEIFAGRVVKREFGSDALTVVGFVIEHADGTRQLINVQIPPDLDMATRDVVYDGLPRLLKEGRSVRGRVLACGAAGRVLNLEEIR